MRLEYYKCKSCGWSFSLNMTRACGSDIPLYCPCCGSRWKVEKTPTQIVEEIKTIYHCSQDEEKMEKLLNELKEMAEGIESDKNKPIYDSRPITTF